MEERARDLSWESLVEVTQASIPADRGACNHALAEIRTMMEDAGLSDEGLADEIVRRAELYRKLWPTMALTPTALAKHWRRVPIEYEQAQAVARQVEEREEERKKTRGQNLYIHSDCVSCGGMGWVVVAWRKPVQSQWMAEHKIEPTSHPNERGYEEAAPCPACVFGQKVEAKAYGPQGFWRGRQWAYGTEPHHLVILG